MKLSAWRKWKLLLLLPCLEWLAHVFLTHYPRMGDVRTASRLGREEAVGGGGDRVDMVWRRVGLPLSSHHLPLHSLQEHWDTPFGVAVWEADPALPGTLFQKGILCFGHWLQVLFVSPFLAELFRPPSWLSSFHWTFLCGWDPWPFRMPPVRMTDKILLLREANPR
jgi:hypothetical protein